MALASLTFKDIVAEARAIPPFTGENTYSLTSFITEVEFLNSLTNDIEIQTYISRIIIGKIQGAAATAIRRLINPRWIDIKHQLIKSFGVTEEYLHLKDQADNIQTRNVSSLYNSLSSILDRLNMKYALDESKPIDFKPQCNETSMLEKFLNKIDRVDAMYIRTKGITTLEEAYHALLVTGINNRNNSHNNSSNNNNRNNKNIRDEHNHSSRPNQDQRFSGQFHRNNHSSRNQNERNFYNRNFNKFNGNFNQRNFNDKNFTPRNSNDRSSTQRNFNRYNTNGNSPAPEPMDVDHASVVSDHASFVSENFPLSPPTQHYP